MILCDFKLVSSSVLILMVFSLIGVSYGGFQPHNNGFNSLPEHSTPTPLRNIWTDPYFDIMMPRNVTALVGKSAYLSCRVRNLGNKTVAWVRHRDTHILTVGTYTYTSDQRFQTTHHKDTDEWTLHIKWAQPRDAGVYECQVSSQPVKSYIVMLSVVDRKLPPSDPYRLYNDRPHQYSPSDDDNSWPPPRFSASRYDDLYRNLYPHDIPKVPTATILGGPDLYVDKGSTINLTCAIRFSPEAPAYIFWYHQDESISFDSSRSGISLKTSRDEMTTSYLLIKNADLSDSGKYTCAPSNADVANIRVHVLNGERPEAMQTGSAGLSSSCLSIPTLIAISSIYNYFRLRLQLSNDYQEIR